MIAAQSFEKTRAIAQRNVWVGYEWRLGTYFADW